MPHDPPQFRQLRDVAALREAAAKQETRLVNQLHGLVATAASKIPSAPAGDKLPPLNFARLREMVSITQVLEHVHWHPRKRRGEQWRGACPLHEETDPQSEAFAVRTRKSRYCCHRCGSQGNALDLWIALGGKPILEASWNLVQTFGLKPPLLEE